MKLYYHPLSPPARAVIVTAKHLLVDLELKEVDLFAGETRTEEYLKMNPSHTVPTLVDGNVTLFESRALMQYIANKYRPNSPLYPSDPHARALVDMVLFYDASSFTPALRGLLLPRLIQKVAPSNSALEELKEKVEILEKMLGNSIFMTGKYLTLADISIATQMPILKVCAPGMISPQLQSWYDRVRRDCPSLDESNSSFDYEAALKI